MAPILEQKSYGDPAVFTPANLLREARRQKVLPEGTSYHYEPPTSPFAELRLGLGEMLRDAFDDGSTPSVARGAAWTTDAPFRETAAEIERHRAAGILAVEMEAAALYAFARATGNFRRSEAPGPAGEKPAQDGLPDVSPGRPRGRGRGGEGDLRGHAGNLRVA